mgnify:CR=1 FL=1
MKNSRKEKINKIKLLLLFSGSTFAFILITTGIILGIIFLLIHFDVITAGANVPNPKRFVIYCAAVSLAVGSIIAFSTGSFSLTPFNKVLIGMDELASGNYKARVKFNSFFAKTRIAKNFEKSFNTMASELENTEMLRSDFINNFSHEFKTPIVSISGFAKLLKRADLTEEQRKEYIDIIEEESLRLSNMATNVLKLTKVENQVVLSDKTRFNISEQIRNCVLLLENKWTKKNIDFIIDFDEYLVETNEEIVRDVWINLIDNAIKFTPEGGKIGIDIYRKGNNIEVSVINTGSSIEADKMDMIFNKFYQADESHASEGHGIGLAIVKHVVKLLEGSVSAKSEGNVTNFTVILPIAVD